ncbi:NRDE protein-domain-containing protein [Aspergillus egyptiacus]|nr:NRDE protein-domain-containing protein [Aspergillus egyptiacus]
MCIAILSTAHPDYQFIIINNRDEFLNRPTSRPNWWPAPNTHILGARDLARPAHGTWLGITKHGRVAVLTNCFETDSARAIGSQSRGAIINGWLTSLPTETGNTKVDDFVKALKESGDLSSVGGFNLLLGDLSQLDEPGQLAILSNRSSSRDCSVGDPEVMTVDAGSGQTLAMSNMPLGLDHNPATMWKKISLGESLTSEAITDSLRSGEGEDAFVERLFGVLSRNTLPRLSGKKAERAESYLSLLRESIFIPVIGKAVREEHDGGVGWNEELLDHAYMEGLYGTQTQTVLLIGYDGRVRYVARTLYDKGGHPLPMEERDRSFEFRIEK